MKNNNSDLKDRAFKIYEEKDGNIKSGEIAEIIGVTPRKISNWKTNGKWDKKLGYKKNKRGAPRGNTNAVGNTGGAPKGNNYAEKEGWYKKHFPRESISLIDEVKDGNLIELQWALILTQWIAIIRAQKIMYVKNSEDITKYEKKKKLYSDKNMKTEEIEYEIQFAWDKQEKFLNAQSKAMQTLTNMIKRYDELLNNNWELATEEQKARVDKLNIEIEKNKIETDILNKKNEEGKDKGPAKIEFTKAGVNNG